MQVAWVGLVGAIAGASVGGLIAWFIAREGAREAKALQQAAHAHEREARVRSLRLERLEALHVELERWSKMIGTLLMYDHEWVARKITREARRENALRITKESTADYPRLRMMLSIHLPEHVETVRLMDEVKTKAVMIARSLDNELPRGASPSTDPAPILNAWGAFDEVVARLSKAIEQEAISLMEQ